MRKFFAVAILLHAQTAKDPGVRPTPIGAGSYYGNLPAAQVSMEPDFTAAFNRAVVVPNTPHRYAARVVGYDIADDVAILQLQSATNLNTITIKNSTTLTIGANVTTVENSGGIGLFLIQPPFAKR